MAALALKGKHEPVDARTAARRRRRREAFARRLDAPMVGRERELGGCGTHSTQALSRPLVPALHGPRRRRRRQVAAAARVPRARATTPRRARALPAVRRGDHVLARRRGREAAAGAELDGRRARDGDRARSCGRRASVATSRGDAWAFRKLLETVAASAPLVCVFDDIHWGEPTFLDLVEHVADLSPRRADPAALHRPAGAARPRGPAGAAASSTRRPCCSSRSPRRTPTR